MHKIANADQLQSELRRILAASQQPHPSREHLAASLRELADRVASRTKSANLAPWHKLQDQLEAIMADIDKADEAGDRAEIVRLVKEAEKVDEKIQAFLRGLTKTASAPATAPQVNLNGNSVDSLIDECEKASRALYECFNAVGDMTVHGRNYLDQSLYSKARAEQERRLDDLRRINKEIESIYESLQDQKDARIR